MWPRTRSCSSSSQEQAQLWNEYMERPAKEVVDLVDEVVEETVEYEDNEFKELKILNYLMGKPLTAEEEAEVLLSLQNTNASCIEDLLQIINEDSAEQKNNRHENLNLPPNEQTESTLSVVSCMRLKIGSLELSPEGLELCQTFKQNSRITSLLFLVEYLPPRSCVNNTAIRISSKRICNNVITFEQEKMHSCESSKSLEFTILIKKSGAMETVFGFASFDWAKYLLATGNKCDISLIVNHPTKNIVLGKLKIRMHLGEESAVSRQNREINAIPRQRLEPVSREPSEPEVQVVGEVKRTKSPPKEPILKESVLLRSLFIATSAQGFTDVNLFLVLKSFWLDEDLKSPISSGKDVNFNFHMSAPVLLSSYFLSRCKGNNAILEVWNASEDGDELVGITLLPLHTFYLAYHDSLVTKALLDCKMPVISVDQWLQVVSPKSGKQVGEVMCLLAFGSDEQVSQLELKRGLRNSAAPSPTADQRKPVTKADDEVVFTHTLNIAILKVKELFGASLEADCYVGCKIPVLNENGHLDFKKFTSKSAVCSVETKLNSKLVFSLNTPDQSCLFKLLGSAEDEITFDIYYRTNHPQNKDIKVARASLPVTEINFLEDQFNISGESAFLSLALPLKTENSEVPLSNKNASLVVRLEYFKKSSTTKDKPLDQIHSSIATQTDISEKEESEKESQSNDQLWSTTLLSQLQRLRISKTDTSAPKEEAPKKTFRCHIKVEKAIQLPYTKTTTRTAITHSEPCTYVTISNEGDVKTSPIILYSIDPAWNWSCEVELPSHLLLEGGENLVLKVWQLPSCSDTPSTKSNAILCFAAVQIADLKYGLPKISGWFNLVNYSGKYCGKIYMSLSPLENLPELMFPNRGVPKQNPLMMPMENVPVEPPLDAKPNPFIDLSSSVMESTLRKQMVDLDELTSLLKGEVSDSSRKTTPDVPENCIAPENLDDLEIIPLEDSKKDGSSDGSEEESSTDSVDSDVAKLLAKFDLETLHKIVEQLDDEVMKMSHGSKPDYVCAKTKPPVEDEKKDNEVPAIEADQASVGSHSDSGISTSARKRHLHP
ncbi:C2 domain-containing protein 3-like [Neocloeon triangulifer]|uniref:C2 domain-containing protein 3-like n=1 Tax=Neocloeon triangulifer TaxID=2078957 RepID=UPI00286EBC90|nr:C2 domain-containing protein 3-like [Neocloeon triangulifer]XP_059474347.1 C2 domain-containing protein 3-like [Neocloeon triangulifer]